MRQFLALPLSAEVQAWVGAVLSRAAADLAGWRLSPAASIHLTLRFLGEVDAAGSARAAPVWRAVCAAAASFVLRPTHLGCFPPAGRPRVLWLGLEEARPGGALDALQLELERQARSLGFAPENRPFVPHLTLARAARGARPAAPRPVDRPPEIELVGREVVLFRSELASGGARHTPLERYPLRHGGPASGYPEPP